MSSVASGILNAYKILFCAISMAAYISNREFGVFWLLLKNVSVPRIESLYTWGLHIGCCLGMVFYKVSANRRCH